MSEFKTLWLKRPMNTRLHHEGHTSIYIYIYMYTSEYDQERLESSCDKSVKSTVTTTTVDVNMKVWPLRGVIGRVMNVCGAAVAQWFESKSPQRLGCVLCQNDSKSHSLLKKMLCRCSCQQTNKQTNNSKTANPPQNNRPETGHCVWTRLSFTNIYNINTNLVTSLDFFCQTLSHEVSPLIKRTYSSIHYSLKLLWINKTIINKHGCFLHINDLLQVKTSTIINL